MDKAGILGYEKLQYQINLSKFLMTTAGNLKGIYEIPRQYLQAQEVVDHLLNRYESDQGRHDLLDRAAEYSAIVCELGDILIAYCLGYMDRAMEDYEKLRPRFDRNFVVGRDCARILIMELITAMEEENVQLEKATGLVRDIEQTLMPLVRSDKRRHFRAVGCAVRRPSLRTMVT